MAVFNIEDIEVYIKQAKEKEHKFIKFVYGGIFSKKDIDSEWDEIIIWKKGE